MTDGQRAVKQRVRESGTEDNPWPDEPSEFDPDSLGPDVPTFDEQDAQSADPEMVRHFYAGVILANVGLLGISLGAMLAYFRGQAYVGGALLIVGIIALVRTHGIVREYGGI